LKFLAKPEITAKKSRGYFFAPPGMFTKMYYKFSVYYKFVIITDCYFQHGSDKN